MKERDYSLVIGKIRTVYQNKGYGKQFAKDLGISYTSLSNKLKGKAEFTIDEVRKTAEFLSLTNDQVRNIFFAE